VHFAHAAAIASSTTEAAATLGFARGATIGTTAGGVGEPLLLMKFLFTGGEYKGLAAIAAG